MTTEEALEFLRHHQPMPDDDKLSEELITRYDEVRKFFIANPNPACIPLFLSSFGEIDGFGVYQVVDDVFRQYPAQEVIPHLRRALASSRHSVRCWAAELAADFPSPELLDPLVSLLETEEAITRFFAILALGEIDHPRVISILRRALETEWEEENLDLIKETLAERTR